MKKRIDPLLIYWLVIAISVFLIGIFGCKANADEQTWQYEQAKVRRTVVGRLNTSKTVYIALNNRDILYISVRHTKSKTWFPVMQTGIEYTDRTDPYCIIYWKGINTRIKFYNLHTGDYYKISVMR